MVIQINNLQALDRLIGGDTQLEFDIRQNIVDAFVKKHLKQVATEHMVERATSMVKEELNEKYFTRLSWSSPVTLTVAGKAAFESKIQDRIDKVVSSVFNESDAFKNINNVINNAAAKIEAQLTDELLKGRIEQLVDQRIKERLNIK